MFEKGKIESSCIKYFIKLFSKESATQFFDEMMGLLNIDRNILRSLQFGNVMSIEEVWAVVKSFDGYKAMGPDGFSTLFYQKTWNIIGREVTMDIKEAFEKGYIHKYFKTSSIILIPESNNITTWNDFRPICLTPMFSKINSKIMAMRLQNIMPRIVKRN